MSNRVVHFEIPSDNPEKNMKFFEEVFQWKFTKFGNDPYWLAATGDEKLPGINGAVMKQIAPGQPLINTIEVSNIDETIKKIMKAGGEIMKPKRSIPTVGWLAFFTDPDGNVHGVMEADTNAR